MEGILQENSFMFFKSFKPKRELREAARPTSVITGQQVNLPGHVHSADIPAELCRSSRKLANLLVFSGSRGFVLAISSQTGVPCFFTRQRSWGFASRPREDRSAAITKMAS